MDDMNTQPTTGPERGRALRRIIRGHDLTVAQFARLAGIGEQTVAHLINGDSTHKTTVRRHGKAAGTRPLGRDLATLTPRTAARVARAIGILEPAWGDADLQRALGLPQEVWEHWRLHRLPQAPPRPAGEQREVYLPGGLWGDVALSMPGTVRVSSAPGDLAVWVTGGSALVVPWGSQERGELLGSFRGFTPDPERGRPGRGRPVGNPAILPEVRPSAKN